MELYNFSKKRTTHKTQLPLLSVEPLDFFDQSTQISNDYRNNKFIDYEFTSDEIINNLFDTFIFKVFSESKELDFEDLPQINLIATIKQTGIQNIGSAETFVNKLNKVFSDNDPFTDVDVERIISGSWRGRGYFINEKGKIVSETVPNSLLVNFNLDEKKFEFSMIGYNFFEIKEH